MTGVWTSGWWRRALWIVLLLTVVAGCATVDRVEDLRIESEVKARLVAEKDANLTRLGVLSSNGVVYLSGRVESPDQRAQAEQLARGVRGVRRIVNALAVGSAPR
jgi:hyperosmotically inducible periplasmic protein